VLDSQDVAALVSAQLARIGEPHVLARAQELLVPPRAELRPWDYGTPHQYTCWIVLEHQESNTAIAYCEEGFGPRCPWGLLFLSGPHTSMGMDSSWFSTLEGALRDSFAYDDPLPFQKSP
jgi:hypothetical protein